MTSWKTHVQDPRRVRAIHVRDQIETGIEEFFRSQGFQKVRTPLLVRSPGMEPHIRPFRVTSSGQPMNSDSPFLQTSPEFAMKKLLVGGLKRIFQISPAFRSEPPSVTHHPEFTLLEWYRAEAGYLDIMNDTENLFASLAQKLFGREELTYQGRKISVKTPWPRLSVRELFREHTGVELVQDGKARDLTGDCRRLGLQTDASDTWDDLYFKIWLNLIEPKLPADRAVFVTRYPASQAALSVIDKDPDGSEWAKRFEVYAGGLELGNAFEELTDASEQRRRFEKDMDLRTEIYGESFPKNPIDEEFIGALEQGLPPSGGIAMGVDRMVMLYADEPEIDRTLWLPSYAGGVTQH